MISGYKFGQSKVCFTPAFDAWHRALSDRSTAVERQAEINLARSGPSLTAPPGSLLKVTGRVTLAFVRELGGLVLELQNQYRIYGDINKYIIR